MSEKAIQKELNRFAVEFEGNVLNGERICTDKFETLCEKWFSDYAERTLKKSGVERARAYVLRVYEYLGHLRVDKITPYIIDGFIKWLSKQEKQHRVNAVSKINLSEYLTKQGYTQKDFAKMCGVSPQTVKSVIDHKKILWSNAEKVSKAMGVNTSSAFNKEEKHEYLSHKTIKNYISFVSSVFDYAVKLHLVKENPCTNAFIPKVEKPEHVMFTVEQAKQFLEILDDAEKTPLKYKAFFQIAIFGGLRRGEILGLEWADIDFDKCMVHIRRTVHFSPTLGVYDTEPKTAGSKRSLILPEIVLFTLKQLRNEQNSQRLKIGDLWIQTNRLFTQWDGKQMNGSSPFAWLKKVCADNSLPQVNIHSFRHLNASLLISNGTDVKTVQTCLGHSQSSTTLDIYAEAFEEQQAQALGAVADILTANTVKQVK